MTFTSFHFFIEFSLFISNITDSLSNICLCATFSVCCSTGADPLAGFKGVLLLREGRGRKGKGEGCVMAVGGMDAPVASFYCASFANVLD